MSGPLRILITNNSLAARGGSEVYVRDLALGLMRRGHLPMVYSSLLGEVAEELRRATIPVFDDIAALNAPPDLIHGQHHLDAMTAILRYPTVPALYFCHGWSPWQELPPVFPSIRRYLAVDDLCRERLLTTPGVPAERIEVLTNAVDLKRFLPRQALPERPASALVFSNYAEPDGYADILMRACQARGIERVDICGTGIGLTTAAPELLLGQYDVVFAKARCALEAMAVGCAVVVADHAGLAGMVDTGNVRTLRRLNFGVRSMQAGTISEASIAAALDRYDARDAAAVSAFIRADADLDAVIDRLLAIYRQILDEPVESLPSDAAATATATYLASLSGLLKGREQAEARAFLSERQNTRLVEASHGQREEFVAQTAAAVEEAANLRRVLADAQAVVHMQADALQDIQRSRAWRLISLYRRFRAWLR